MNAIERILIERIRCRDWLNKAIKHAACASEEVLSSDMCKSHIAEAMIALKKAHDHIECAQNEIDKEEKKDTE